MDKVLLDTDIFSEILKGKNPSVAEKASTYRDQFSRYALSVITIVELVKGFQKAGRDDHIKSLINALAGEEVLPLDSKAAMLAGRIYGELERAGQTIGRADPLIAGIALHFDLVLVTGNTKHFHRVVQLGFPLAIQNWRE